MEVVNGDGRGSADLTDVRPEEQRQCPCVPRRGKRQLRNVPHSGKRHQAPSLVQAWIEVLMVHPQIHAYLEGMGKGKQ